MTPDDLAYIEQERPGREGSTLSFYGRSARGPWNARMDDPELGTFESGDCLTIESALVRVIELVQA
jgi:hypothetical protein